VLHATVLLQAINNVTILNWEANMGKLLFDPKEIIPKFDEFLTSRRLRFEGVAIGGAALVVLDVIQRATRDIDLLETEIPAAISKAASEFASKYGLSEHWFNAGPADLLRYLPSSWKTDLQPLYSGMSLNLKTLSRINIIRTKFWAMCDRMRDVDDLIAIAPSDDEIEIALEWVRPLDANPAWPKHAESMAHALRRRLGRG
jgi:hypothetical protein